MTEYINMIPAGAYFGAGGGLVSWYAYEGNGYEMGKNIKWAMRSIPSRIIVAGALGAAASTILPMIPALPGGLLQYSDLVTGGLVFYLYAKNPMKITSEGSMIRKAEIFLSDKVFGAVIKDNI
jgi:hypothetical protein